MTLQQCQGWCKVQGDIVLTLFLLISWSQIRCGFIILKKEGRSKNKQPLDVKNLWSNHLFSWISFFMDWEIIIFLCIHVLDFMVLPSQHKRIKKLICRIWHMHCVWFCSLYFLLCMCVYETFILTWTHVTALLLYMYIIHVYYINPGDHFDKYIKQQVYMSK